MHVHVYQNAMRSLGQDLDLVNWLNRVKYPILRCLKPEDIELLNLLGFVEMVRFGTTGFVYILDVPNSRSVIDRTIQAASKIGLRMVLAVGIREATETALRWGFPEWLVPVPPRKVLSMIEDSMKFRRGDMIKVCPAPSATFYMNFETLQMIAGFAERHATPIHMHVAETKSSQEECLRRYGVREVELLLKAGLLGRRAMLVHSIWLSEKEMKIISSTGSTVVHCPVSNGFLASGVARIHEMVKKGVNVTLGTDGAASNDVYDMFETVKFTVLTQKAVTCRPKILNSNQILSMAMVNPYAPLGMKRPRGKILEGYGADLVIVNLKKPHLNPWFNLSNLIVYSVRAGDVETVIVDGKPILLEGSIKGVDVHDLLLRVEKLRLKIREIIDTGG